MLQHHVRQCTNPDCRFRFPTTGEQHGADSCPVCAQPTTIVTTTKSQLVPSAINTKTQRHVEVVLDNIRSLRNVGAIFRTSDGAGIRHLHLCGMTATPEHPKMAKTALGAEQVIAWSYGKMGLKPFRDCRKRDI